ncbi:MAG: hypothetical protein ACRDXD_14640 [Acidimicrobiia bacterium]
MMDSRQAFRTRPYRTGTATATAILLIGTAAAAAWLLAAPMVLGPGGGRLFGPLPSTSAAPPAPAALVEGVKVAGSFQTSQPRDPFRPLITEDGQVTGAPPPATPGAPGTTTPGGGFAPSGQRVALIEIREVGGVLRATVTVDGTTFEVGEGDTFAGNFKVVSLDEDSGVFLFGDNAFELSVGQAILK